MKRWLFSPRLATSYVEEKKNKAKTKKAHSFLRIESKTTRMDLKEKKK